MQRDRRKSARAESAKTAPRRLTESRQALGEMLREAGLPLSGDRLDLLWRYHQLIRTHNEEYDLTRLTSFRDFVVKHYIDCLIVPRLTDLPSPLLDIGTGAGFPGIPLKIASPDTGIILSEGRAKRVEFLHLAIHELELQGITVFGRGILPGRLGRTVGGVITRALETSAETLGRVKDILDPGGRVILMKGPQGEDEIPEALKIHGGDYRLIQSTPYVLPGTTQQRMLLVFEKTTSASIHETEASAREVVEITSASNASFREWKTLLSGRGIRKNGLALVSGEKIISEVLSLKPEIVRAWIGAPRLADAPGSLMPEIPRYRLDRELFRELDVHGTDYPLLLVGIPPIRTLEAGLSEGVMLLIPFQDPANVGAVIRSAAAFGVRTVVLLREAANPYHPKSIRAAGAAVFLTSFVEGPSISGLPDLPLPVVALSAEGEDLYDFPFPERFALLPGVEGPGLPEGIEPDFLIRIPMEADVESLNAAVATSIALYEWRRGMDRA